MTTNGQYSTLIAVFSGPEQANQAIDNLRHAGFGYDQIRLVDNGTTVFSKTSRVYSQVIQLLQQIRLMTG